MMSEQQREARRRRSAMLDVAIRWFRGRAGLPRFIDAGEHAHWDPVNRTWQYHIHRRDRRSRRP
jgi:hypothetical protein